MKQNDPSHALLQDADELGHESRAAHGDHAALKLWLRLLATTTQVESEIRTRLRERYGISLARFDYLAQLYRYQDGMKMRDLSRCLMVTGGNVTGLTDALESDGLVVREVDADDRRVVRVRLTNPGLKEFRRMASEHEQWMIELFSALGERQKLQLMELLGMLKTRLAAPGVTGAAGARSLWTASCNLARDGRGARVIITCDCGDAQLPARVCRSRRRND